MNADQNPALVVGPDYYHPGSLRLVLPAGLDRDDTLKGLAQAIQDVRAMLADHIGRFQQLVEECATSGDQLRQAQCRGQVLATAHAATALDENIIGVFDLWDQYEAQDPGLRCPEVSGQGSNRVLIWKGMGSSAGKIEAVLS